MARTRLTPQQKAARQFERAEAQRKKKGQKVPRRGPEAYKRRKLRELARTGAATPYQRQKQVSQKRYGVATPKQATRERVRFRYLRITGEKSGSALDNWIREHPVAASEGLHKIEQRKAEKQAGRSMSRQEWYEEWEDTIFDEMPPEGANYGGEAEA